MSESVVLRGQIDGEFEGFDDEKLFKLMDGSYWLQAEYKYWYHYEYMPRVEIVRASGALYLRIAGRTEQVRVEQLTSVIKSRIAGEFKGWEGESEYQLINGEIWKQAAYKYEYQYAYQPEVVIYQTSSGTVMDVEGCRANVRRVR
jgi:hypothetical protein